MIYDLRQCQLFLQVYFFLAAGEKNDIFLETFLSTETYMQRRWEECSVAVCNNAIHMGAKEAGRPRGGEAWFDIIWLSLAVTWALADREAWPESPMWTLFFSFFNIVIPLNNAKGFFSSWWYTYRCNSKGVKIIIMYRNVWNFYLICCRRDGCEGE